MRPIWNATVVIDGNHYLLAEAVDQGVLRSSETRTVCPLTRTVGVCH
ncbi:MAG: hypothetical protein ACRCZD_13465 [Phycicoccus sp.]